MSSFIILPIVVLLVAITFSFIFKGADKVDKGFEINYFKLSYRRKMIRNLTSLPIVIPAFIVIYFFSDWSTIVNIFFGLIIFLVFAIELFYNFNMWKKNER